jgi:hypothetical protein
VITLSLNATSFVPGDEVVATVVVTQPEPQVKEYVAVAAVDIGGVDYTDEQPFTVTFPALTVGEVIVSIVYPEGGVAFSLTQDPEDPNVFRGVIPPLGG